MCNKGMYLLFKRCQERKSLVTSNFANLINFLKNHNEYDGERKREREIESLHEREKHYERKKELTNITYQA